MNKLGVRDVSESNELALTNMVRALQSGWDTANNRANDDFPLPTSDVLLVAWAEGFTRARLGMPRPTKTYHSKYDAVIKQICSTWDPPVRHTINNPPLATSVQTATIVGMAFVMADQFPYWLLTDDQRTVVLQGLKRFQQFLEWGV